MTDEAAQVTERLTEDRVRLGRTSTAERVAGILRERITEGMFTPGTRLSEEAIGTALGVSRNTLREAFRLLSHERLLVHELNRGVFVRRLTTEDVIDLYHVRRLLECWAIRQAGPLSEESLAGLREAVAVAESAAGEQRWEDVGTANMRFHAAIVRLAGSPRLDETMGRLLAELRLAFLEMDNPHAFHEPYLVRNREILRLIEAGDTTGAERLLDDYLADAERQLVQAHTSST
ncbi:GntR family transcriptional regulator [Sphaerisporangium melleum]|uniref:GntR family transcriptional regulator n=1 Tax=Sphaerisporangium melleum TaxID=321316 RepID=UPI0016642026|nr:GntR family transcriptional regulator [Sphaerisporangium melleum]